MVRFALARRPAPQFLSLPASLRSVREGKVARWSQLHFPSFQRARLHLKGWTQETTLPTSLGQLALYRLLAAQSDPTGPRAGAGHGRATEGVQLQPLWIP